MLESTKERNYSKELSRFNEMREIFELRYVHGLSNKEVMKQKSLTHSRYFHILRTFAAEHPDIAEDMKKTVNDICPEDYKKLLDKVSFLETELKKEKLRADFYEEMVSFGKEVYGIDLKKAGNK